MENKGKTNSRCPSRFVEMDRCVKQVGRIIAFLTREQLDFIDKISKDALFSTGKKLSRTTIVQVIIEAVRKIDLSGEDIHCADELEQRILDMVKKTMPEIAENIKKEISNKNR
ncbi:MAG: hypothetical protein JW946_01065 [Candidatus Omnitrophica bacterium]|nr:hypothetical protein [Candidatus Omnitrophota bacterium]